MSVNPNSADVELPRPGYPATQPELSEVGMAQQLYLAMAGGIIGAQITQPGLMLPKLEPIAEMCRVAAKAFYAPPVPKEKPVILKG